MNSNTNPFNIDLPKWPALVVVGNKVTKEQAEEILIRTTPTYFGCNDKPWEDKIGEVFGFKKDKLHGFDWKSVQTVADELDILQLSYLSNERICSAWIGGPHGWCDWNGNIGCGNYNIGKWPSVKSVAEDWKQIAEAFPFLTLKAQLFSGETSEEGVKPLVEFGVSNGEAWVTDPGDTIGHPHELTEQDMMRRFTAPFGERGCDETTLRRAVEALRNK